MNKDAYIKQLEEQVEKLEQKLSVVEMTKEEFDNSISNDLTMVEITNNAKKLVHKVLDLDINNLSLSDRGNLISYLVNKKTYSESIHIMILESFQEKIKLSFSFPFIILIPIIELSIFVNSGEKFKVKIEDTDITNKYKAIVKKLKEIKECEAKKLADKSLKDALENIK